MKLKSNTILIIISTLVVAAGAYWYFFAGTGNETPLSVETTGSITQARFQSLSSQLQPISFDTKIFSDSRFMVLIDLTTPLTQDPSGRVDPFAPVSGQSSTSGSGRGTATP